MLEINDDKFEKIVSSAIDAIPEKYGRYIENLAFVVQDEPNAEQRKRLGLHCNQTLYGLYEGIPLTKRGSGYNLVLPDKITIFKKPIEHASRTMGEVDAQVRETVWHEVAHYFGLDHEQMHNIKNNRKK